MSDVGSAAEEAVKLLAAAEQWARGRAAHWSQIHGPVQPARINFVEQRFVAPERYKQWPQAHLHTQWPGAGKPGDPVFDQFYASQFPSMVSFPKQQELNRDGWWRCSTRSARRSS